jgi:predicted RNA-binding Zn-ribbon protein involved in translation (DUF1610 family)
MGIDLYFNEPNKSEEENDMACPSCDHTMHLIEVASDFYNIYHCPRCGTLRTACYNEIAKDMEYEDFVPTRWKPQAVPNALREIANLLEKG